MASETVIGSALMLVGANSRTVAHAVGEKLAEINQDHAARRRTIVPTLDRSAIGGGDHLHRSGATWPKARCWWWRSCSSFWAIGAPR